MHLTKLLGIATTAIVFTATNVAADVNWTGNVVPDPVTSTSATYLKIGDSADGSMTIDSNGSDHDVFSETCMIGGLTAGIKGEVMVSGANSTWDCANSLYVGWKGNGTLDVNRGASVSSFAGSIAVQSDSVSSVTIDGEDSNWTMTTTYQTFSVGGQGYGTLHIQNGGTLSNAVGIKIGDYAGSTGSVVVEGAGATLTADGSSNIGNNGNGTLEIKDGGLVSTGLTRIGYGSTSKGVVTVDGANSKWTASKLYLGLNAPGMLNISNGGKVEVGGDVSNRYGSEISIGVSNNNMFTVAGDLRNETVVCLTAGPQLAAGAYAPIAVTGSWTGSGLYEAVGGTWNPATHVFTVSDTLQATAGATTQISLPINQRLAVGDNLGVSFASGSGTIDFAAAVTPIETTDLLQSLLGAEESVLSSWDFTTDLAPGNETMLSYLLPEGSTGLQIWHYDSSNGWTEHHVENVIFNDGWASFTVNSFSSYAVTGVGVPVPEPTMLVLLAMGACGLALLRRGDNRRR